MDKRIRRKVHSRYLPDAVCDISQASIWRKKLFDSEYGTRFLIDCNSTIHQNLDYLRKFLCRYKLRYFVSKVLYSETTGWEDYEGLEDDVMFKFEVVEFPEIFAFSANNSKSI